MTLSCFIWITTVPEKKRPRIANHGHITLHQSTTEPPWANYHAQDRFKQTLVFLDTRLSIWTRAGSMDSVLLHIDYHSNWLEKSFLTSAWGHNNNSGTVSSVIFITLVPVTESESISANTTVSAPKSPAQPASSARNSCSLTHSNLLECVSKDPFWGGGTHQTGSGGLVLHQLHSLLRIVMLVALVVIQPFWFVNFVSYSDMSWDAIVALIWLACSTVSRLEAPWLLFNVLVNTYCEMYRRMQNHTSMWFQIWGCCPLWWGQEAIMWLPSGKE